MSAHPHPAIHRILSAYPAFPLEPAHWQAVADELNFSPRQRHIVELLLRGLADKEIATVMTISQSTLRTHLTRIFARTRTGSRMELAMCVLQTAMRIPASDECR